MKLATFFAGACIAAITMAQQGMRPAPELTGSTWINTSEAKPITIASLKGKVVVVHFWTFDCINCRHNLPHYDKWLTKYKDEAFQMIGVHTPELPQEKDEKNVREAVKKLGIRFPVVIDEKEANWNRYKVDVWPTMFVIDKKGVIRGGWLGELNYGGKNGYDEMTKLIDFLLKEKA